MGEMNATISLTAQATGHILVKGGVNSTLPVTVVAHDADVSAGTVRGRVAGTLNITAYGELYLVSRGSATEYLWPTAVGNGIAHPTGIGRSSVLINAGAIGRVTKNSGAANATIKPLVTALGRHSNGKATITLKPTVLAKGGHLYGRVAGTLTATMSAKGNQLFAVGSGTISIGSTARGGHYTPGRLIPKVQATGFHPKYFGSFSASIIPSSIADGYLTVTGESNATIGITVQVSADSGGAVNSTLLLTARGVGSVAVSGAMASSIIPVARGVNIAEGMRVSKASTAVVTGTRPGIAIPKAATGVVKAMRPGLLATKATAYVVHGAENIHEPFLFM